LAAAWTTAILIITTVTSILILLLLLLPLPRHQQQLALPLPLPLQQHLIPIRQHNIFRHLIRIIHDNVAACSNLHHPLIA
jgi:hypothetical protein